MRYDLSTKEARQEYIANVAHSLYLEGNVSFSNPHYSDKKLIEKFIDGDISLDECADAMIKETLSCQ